MSWKRKAYNTILWASAGLMLFFAGISFYFYFQKDKVINAVIRQLNDQLAVPIDVYQVDVSFRHFPRLSVVFTKVRCTESKAENPELLLNVEKLYIKFSLLDVVYGRYYISEISLDNGYVHVKFFEDGNTNFAIFKTDTTAATSPIDIEKLYLINIQLTYSDFREKIFASQFIFNSEISTSFRENVKAKGSWNAQNTYVRLPDFLMEDKMTHSSIFEYSSEGDFFSLVLNKTSLDKIKFDFAYQRALSGEKFSLQFQNQSIYSASFLQKIIKNHIADIRLKNDNISAKIIGERSKQNWSFTATFNGKAQQLFWGKNSIQIDDISTAGSAHYDDRGLEVKLSTLSGRSESTNVSGNISILNTKSTIIQGQLAINGEPNGLAKLAGMAHTVRGKGTLSAQVQFTYIIEDRPKQNKNLILPEKFDCTLRSDGLELQIEENVVSIPALSLTIDKHGFDLRQRISVNGRALNTDLQIRGLATWLVDSTAFLDLRGLLSIDLYDEYFWKSSAESTSTPLSALDRTRFDMQIEVGQYVVNQLKCNEIRALARKSGKDIELRQLSMNLFGGALDFDGYLIATSNGFILRGSSHLRNIDLAQLMLGFNDFEQQTLTHKNLHGKLSGSVQFSLPLAPDLDPDVKRISADMDLRIQRGRLLNFEPMEALGRFADVDELKDIRFDELTNRLKIDNQLIQIPQFEIRSNALNLVLEGTHSFENVIDYKVGLSLSDVLYQKRKRSRTLNDLVFEEDDSGARIWIRISGTTDEPKITPIKAELIRSRNQLFTKPKEELSDSSQPKKPAKSPFKFEWDEN